MTRAFGPSGALAAGFGFGSEAGEAPAASRDNCGISVSTLVPAAMQDSVSLPTESPTRNDHMCADREHASTGTGCHNCAPPAHCAAIQRAGRLIPSGIGHVHDITAREARCHPTCTMGDRMRAG